MASEGVLVEDFLYDEIKKYVEKDPVNFPTIKNFIDKAVSEKLEQLKKEKEK